MKRERLLNLLALLLCVICALEANAYDFEVDGIYYNRTSSNTVEVTYEPLHYELPNYNKYSIVIPSSVTFDGVNYTITAIGDSAFFMTYAHEVTIPETVTLIGKDAFVLLRPLKLTCLPVAPPFMEGAFSHPVYGHKEFPFDVYDYLYYDDEFGDNYPANEYDNSIIVLLVPSEAYQSYSEINDHYDYFDWIYGYDWEITPIPPVTMDCTYSADRLVDMTITITPTEECKIYAEAYCCDYMGSHYFYSMNFDYEENENGAVSIHLSYPYNICYEPPAFAWMHIHAVAEGKLPSEEIFENYVNTDEHCGYNCELWPPYDFVGFDFMESGICYRYCYDGYWNDAYDSDEVYVASPVYGDGSFNNGHQYVEYSGDMVIPSSVLGHTVTGIDNGALGRFNAFEDCVDLTGISLPNTIMDMYWSAFTGCTNLKRMILPVTINSYYIPECYSENDLMCELESLYFTGDGDWYGGPLPDSLETLYIGRGVTGVEYMNVNPKTIYSYATTPPVCKGKGDGYNDFPSFSGYDAELHVPAPSLAAYLTAPYWCNFTNVIGDITPISDFSLAQDTVEILKGSQFTFAPIITPAHVVPDTIIWQSTNTWVATVDNGVVTAVGVGECEIQAICQGKFVICRVFVSEILPTEVTLDHKNAKMEVGETLQLSATVLPTNATEKTLYWSTSNSRIVTVNNNGLVTAIAPGTATIKASTAGGTNLSASCTVVVTENLDGYDNYLSLNDVEAFHGDTIVIPVAMTNAAQIVSFQTDIFLPEGLEIVQEDGEYLIDPSDRMTRTHSIMSNDVSSGAVRVLCYSSNYKPFTGESGDDLFYITVKVADDAEGDYIIQLKNTLFTTSDFEEIVAPDVAADVYVKAYLLGDANNSGTVTVTDVVVTSQYILERNPEPFVFDAADINADGNITVTDVTRIAWMVLNPTMNALLRAPAVFNSSDLMSGKDITLNVGETRTVSIVLDNEMDYTAFQLDLTLPDGMTARNFRLTDRAGSHSFDVNTLHNGDIRTLCYSPAMTAINGHDGALLTFDVTATTAIDGVIGVNGIELVTTDCRTVSLDGFAIGVNATTSVNELSGTKDVARVDYYNIAGQRISRPESGVTLIVTTYTDGTRITTKVIQK